MKKTKETSAWIPGFKAFSYNMCCRGKRYAPGHTYKEADAVMCVTGMHFCQNPLDVLGYYNITGNAGAGPIQLPSRYATVLGAFLAPLTQTETQRPELNKDCARVLQVVRELTLPELAVTALEYYNTATIEGLTKPGSKLRERYTFTNAADRQVYYGFIYGASLATTKDCYCMAVGEHWDDITVAAHESSLALTTDINSIAIAGAREAAAITIGANSVAATTVASVASVAGEGSVAVCTGYAGYAEALAPNSVALVTGVGGMVRGVIGSFIGGMRPRDDSGSTELFMERVDGKRIKANRWYRIGRSGLVDVLNNKKVK